MHLVAAVCSVMLKCLCLHDHDIYNVLFAYEAQVGQACEQRTESGQTQGWRCVCVFILDMPTEQVLKALTWVGRTKAPEFPQDHSDPDSLKRRYKISP